MEVLPAVVWLTPQSTASDDRGLEDPRKKRR